MHKVEKKRLSESENLCDIANQPSSVSFDSSFSHFDPWSILFDFVL